MSSRLASSMLTLLLVLSVVAVWFVLTDFYQCRSQLDDGAELVVVDTGLFYLLVLSVFWPIFAADLIGRRVAPGRLAKPLTLLLVIWLLGSASLAHLLGTELQDDARESGYSVCPHPDDQYRTFWGKTLVFSLGSCEATHLMRSPGCVVRIPCRSHGV